MHYKLATIYSVNSVGVVNLSEECQSSPIFWSLYHSFDSHKLVKVSSYLLLLRRPFWPSYVCNFL